MKSLLFLMVVSSFLLGTAMGQTINFETLPGGGAISDGMLIHDQFNVSPYWVTFELLGVSPETGPKIARVGPPLTAFYGQRVTSDCSGEDTIADKPGINEPVGCFFLTDDNVVRLNQAYSLLVSYTYPVRQAGGHLLDIDYGEEWTITAFAQDSTTVIDQVVLSAGDANTGNGEATAWEFDVAQDIYYIRFDLTDCSGGGGLAFDNFSPASSPPTATETTSWGEIKSKFR